MSPLDSIIDSALQALRDANDTRGVEALRVQYLGKKGELTEQMKTLGALPPEERKSFGAEVNRVKQQIESALEERLTTLKTSERDAQMHAEALDVTLPAAPSPTGSIHPITQVMEEVTALFAQFGFTVADGPEIEDEFHNFDALNIPETHPARAMHDTFYLNAERDGKPLLLRTHTSPVQIRTMLSTKPPIRIIAPGRTYRSDSDQTHTPMFHQVEGLVIEKNIHMGHLKGLLHDFLCAFFGLKTVPMRFRTSFFPFTEPSAEVDIGCKRGRDALAIGEGDDWLEILGCGMVHPNVLTNCGIDANEYQGFAFGCGIERLAMLKYNIPDLRTFFDSDLRWLTHYGFSPAAQPSSTHSA
jgi:phenylalanyl-tRNA synthetase alpha chain